MLSALSKLNKPEISDLYIIDIKDIIRFFSTTMVIKTDL